MKVKIGDKIYDANEELVIVYLSDDDKKHIADMPDENHYYASYPDNGEWNSDDVLSKMMEFKVEVEAKFYSS